MHKLEISATVTNADGTEYHHSLNRWNVDDATLGLMTGMLDTLHTHAKAHDNSGDKTVTLSASVDGAKPVVTSLSSVSKKAVRSVEREFLKMGNQLVNESERLDKAHSKP